jgi:23S rRNA pseudouridine1911/1915/1917 synthase
MTELLYLDRDLLVSVKPTGLLSEGEAPNCFPAQLAEALRAEGEQDALFPVHRLDRETEGLMVYARTSPAAAALSRAITEGTLKKEYLAVIHGTPEKEEDTLRDLMFYDRARGKSFLVTRQRKGVKEAVLDYRVLACKDGLSLLHIRLHTGRTHQIRVQFGGRGLPLCGDRRYGAPASPYRLSLAAARLSFPHPKNGQPMSFVYRPQTDADTAFSLFLESLDEWERG